MVTRNPRTEAAPADLPMNDNDATATAPPDDPKADAHPHAYEAAPDTAHEPAPVPETAPEPTGAEAGGVERVTEPDPVHAPDPAPAAPPELAEVAEMSGEVAPDEPKAEEEGHAPEPGSVAPPTDEPKAEDEPPKPAKRPRTPKLPKAASTAPAPDAEVAAPDEPADAVTPTEPPAEAPLENTKKWYAIKVQSGREDTIKAAILRRVAIEGLEDVFGQIMIPFEEEVIKKTVRVKDKKSGEYTTQEKKVTRKKKKFQGYLFAELEFNDRILYLFRETSGVGDFLNLRTKPGQQPTPEPMPEHEVQSMLTGVKHGDPLKKGNAKVRLDFEKGDRVRIREGPFANNEGEVKVITEPKDPTDTPKVTVVVTLWGRPVDVELDYWQVEKA